MAPKARENEKKKKKENEKEKEKEKDAMDVCEEEGDKGKILTEERKKTDRRKKADKKEGDELSPLDKLKEYLRTLGKNVSIACSCFYLSFSLIRSLSHAQTTPGQHGASKCS